MFKTLQCGDREVRLKYPAKTLLAIRDLAAQKIGEDRLKVAFLIPRDIKEGEAIPDINKMKLDSEIALNFLGQLDIMLWLFGMGLDWSGSKGKPEEAAELFDKYSDVDEADLDTGERFTAFQMAIADAMAASRGVDLKKTLAAAEKMRKDQQERAAEALGIGKPPIDSA